MGKVLSITSAETTPARPLSLRDLGASTVLARRALSSLAGESDSGRRAPLAANSSATGHGLHAAVLRVAASFFVTVRDAQDALCGAVDDMPFTLSFRGPEQPVHRVCLLPDGRFQVQWCATTSGRFTIEVLVKGENVPSSPFSCVAENGRIESHTSLVRGVSQLTRVSAGFPLRFSILARDQAGHAADYSPLATAGHAFSCVATLLEPEGGAPESRAPEAGEAEEPGFLREEGRAGGPLQERAIVVDRRDGSYNCTLAFRRSGTYTVLVTGEDGREIEGSGFKVVTRAGGMDARFCRLHGAGLEGATAGQPAHFRVHALDRYGNTCRETEEAELKQAGRFTVLLVPAASKRAPPNRGKSGRTDAIVTRTNALTSQREAAMMPVPPAPCTRPAAPPATRRAPACSRALCPTPDDTTLPQFAVRCPLPFPGLPAPPPHPRPPRPLRALPAPYAPPRLCASARQVTGTMVPMGGGLYEAEFVVTRAGQYDLQARPIYPLSATALHTRASLTMATPAVATLWLWLHWLWQPLPRLHLLWAPLSMAMLAR